MRLPAVTAAHAGAAATISTVALCARLRIALSQNDRQAGMPRMGAAGDLNMAGDTHAQRKATIRGSSAAPADLRPHYPVGHCYDDAGPVLGLSRPDTRRCLCAQTCSLDRSHLAAAVVSLAGERKSRLACSGWEPIRQAGRPPGHSSRWPCHERVVAGQADHVWDQRQQLRALRVRQGVVDESGQRAQRRVGACGVIAPALARQVRRRLHEACALARVAVSSGGQHGKDVGQCSAAVMAPPTVAGRAFPRGPPLAPPAVSVCTPRSRGQPPQASGQPFPQVFSSGPSSRRPPGSFLAQRLNEWEV